MFPQFLDSMREHDLKITHFDNIFVKMTKIISKFSPVWSMLAVHNYEPYWRNDHTACTGQLVNWIGSPNIKFHSNYPIVHNIQQMLPFQNFGKFLQTLLSICSSLQSQIKVWQNIAFDMLSGNLIFVLWNQLCCYEGIIFKKFLLAQITWFFDNQFCTKNITEQFELHKSF